MLSQQQYGRGSEPGVRPSPLFFAIVAVTALAAWGTTVRSGAAGIAVFVFIAGAWTLSIVFHEFAHAFLAWRGGDRSVPQRGYLTLDPRKYTHPVMSFGIPLFFIIMGGIGLPGGAVLLNRSVLSGPRASIVALAGPLTNLAFGCISLAVLGFEVVDFATQPYLTAAIAFFGFLQIAVFVLNMIPIPGFDGYAVIEPTLSPSTQELMRPVARYGPLVAILFLWQVAPVGDAFRQAIDFFTELFGVDPLFSECGLEHFRFWSSRSSEAEEQFVQELCGTANL
ncbi:MAG: site-2 protease family protein [Acidimicrobiales bacterium]